ncbi:hypothetical protein SAMN05192558_107291 [Actinokineospora alba]|uniref:Uncharacterized protein n=1 Tax=Actinokineospora alba TaxID=504798 RepID=A0A1H0R5G1_9PSEU|nr:hypothetical protein [Actinokineospora alba]TDP70258.1 hypothetical protein C8E96_5861 [Actinokineospora alba]SDI35596.1 hypothetical protein SAMN05421871_104290 [Actinokineospora alba]SDP24296.1 hypothetical protein SAMN05192558_107291 [Actinokineospora alba]
MTRTVSNMACVASGILLAVACGSPGPEVEPTTSATVGGEPTIVVRGKPYTCETIANLIEPCGRDTQEIFDRFGDRIDRYVNGGGLGPLDNSVFIFEDVAYVGLTACTYQRQSKSQADYVAFLLGDADLSAKLEAARGDRVTGLQPAWNRALRFLCAENLPAQPGTAGADDGHIPGVGTRSPGQVTP